jgi:hypothetical protein
MVLEDRHEAGRNLAKRRCSCRGGVRWWCWGYPGVGCRERSRWAERRAPQSIGYRGVLFSIAKWERS